MIDTNTLLSSATTPGAVQTTLSAWNVVALGVGAALVHAYHVIVAGGGIKNIAIKLWNGEDSE
jgi:hypothetical protein